MKKGKVWLLVGVLFSLVCASSSGTECRFFRVTCVEGGAPENLAITSDEFGQIFLEFDTQDQRTYVIEATDSLSPPPAWTGVSAIVGDGQRATWLTTRRWIRTFGGGDWDWAWSAQQTSDGGYIVAGYTESFGPGNVYLVKTDEAGDEVWSRTYGGDDGEFCGSVQQTSDRGYIVAGGTWSFGAGGADVYLIKTDADGNEVWTRTFGGSGDDVAYSVQQTSDGGYIVAGYTESFGAGDRDVYLIKTHESGMEQWSKTFGGSSWDCARSVQETSDGGYIVAGYTRSFGAGENDVYLVRTDVNGNEVWSRTFGGSEPDIACCVQETSDGGYIVAGSTRSFGAGDWDVYLIKTDRNGNAPPPEPTLISVVVSGPDEVNEKSSADYTATAHWDDGSTGDVTASATWFPDSGEHYFSSPGHLVSGEVTSASDESITVCAFYNWQFGVKDVTVNNLATLNSVTISGPHEVSEHSSADYTATAHWDDGSGDVTDSASWSPDSGKHYFTTPGHLVTGEVISDESITVTASYEGKSASKSVTVTQARAWRRSQATRP